MHDGWGGDAILDSYRAERAPIGESIAGQAVGWALNAGILMADAPGKRELLESDTDEGNAARAQLDAELRRDTLSEFDCPGFQLGFRYAESATIVYDDLTAEPDVMLVDYTPTSFPGSRLPHIWLADGTSIYDQLGTGLTLLRVGPDAPTGQALVDAATAGGVPFDILDVDAADVGDDWDRIPLVLVRPDQHIAWRGDESPTAAEATEVINTITREKSTSLHRRRNALRIPDHPRPDDEDRLNEDLQALDPYCHTV